MVPVIVPTPGVSTLGGTAAQLAHVVFATNRFTGLPVVGTSWTSAKSANWSVPSVVMKLTSKDTLMLLVLVNDGEVNVVSTVGVPRISVLFEPVPSPRVA